MTVREEAPNVASRSLPPLIVSLNEDEVRLLRIALHHELNRAEKNIQRLRDKTRATIIPSATEERAAGLRALREKLRRG